MNNPAFMASAGDDGSSGDGGGSGSAGSTTRPVDTTGDPPPMTTASPTTPTTDGPDPVTTSSPATSDANSTGIEPVETTGGVDPDTTTGPDSSTGNLPPECGNGIVEQGEQCDDGQIEPAPDKCSPDCQAMIVKKRIFAFNAMIKGDFMKPQNADGACQDHASGAGLEGDYKALVSDGETRVGSVQPWDGQATDDWPLHSYTAYFNVDQQLVWITLERPLLGAGPDNEGFALLHPITADNQYAVWTGLKSDWLSGPNCNKWAGLDEAIAGKPYKLEGFLDAANASPCANKWGLICVQQ